MKITVVGSYKEELSIRNKDDKNTRAQTLERFQMACSEIGKTLAEEGHRLIVAHPDNPDAAEALALAGFRTKQAYKYKPCPVHEGDPELKAHLDAVEMSDVVILIGGGNATYASGLSALRRRRVIIPVPAFGGSAKDLCDIQEIDDVVPDEIRNLDFQQDDWATRLTTSIRGVLNEYPRVLIIHGRGDNGEALKRRIEEEGKTPTLHGIAKPVIMNLSGSGAVTVPHVFEDLASKVSAAVVLVTADDIGGFARGVSGSDTVPATELKLLVRARENVWVEVGWFWGRLGREKIFLWLKDDVEIPSDLQGVARTEAEDLDKAWRSISSFLESMRSSD